MKSRPLVVAFGHVVAVTPRHKRQENGGEVYALDVTIETPGGPAYLRYWSRDAAQAPTTVGEVVAVAASIAENDGTVSFERQLEPSELDLLLSASGLVTAGK